MACFYLRPAWREKLPNQNGKHEITFSRKGSQMEPDFYIPCGKCKGCTADRSKDWAIRMTHESTQYDRNCFVTLTYADAPPALEKNHVKNFIRRLRRESSRPIRYFVCGEYGEKTHRPHYHAILFNEDFRGGAYPIDDQLYGNPFLSAIWGAGTVSIGDFTHATACYVSGYVTKKLDDKDTFTMQSRKPPIGWNWAMKHQEELQKTETIVIEGREYPIPKKYFDWFDQSNFRPGRVDLDDIKPNRSKFAKPVTQTKLRNRQINHEGKARLKEHKI